MGKTPIPKNKNCESINPPPKPYLAGDVNRINKKEKCECCGAVKLVNQECKYCGY